MVGQVGTPAVQADTGSHRTQCCVTHGVESHVDAEYAEPRERERNGMASTSHRHVQRPRVFSAQRRKPRNPFLDERRRDRRGAAGLG